MLPANCASLRVVLTGRPLAEGNLTIRGCVIRCFNLTCEHLVDSSATGVAVPWPMTLRRDTPAISLLPPITIIQPLPLLNVVAEQSTSNNQSLLEGEETESTLLIDNIGSKVIDELEISLVLPPKFQEYAIDPSTVGWYLSLIVS